jgi:hypothetical protein
LIVCPPFVLPQGRLDDTDALTADLADAEIGVSGG